MNPDFNTFQLINLHNNRIILLYRAALKYFNYDLSLWIDYIKFLMKIVSKYNFYDNNYLDFITTYEYLTYLNKLFKYETVFLLYNILLNRPITISVHTYLAIIEST